MEKLNNMVENSLGSSKKFENHNEELFDYQLQYIDKIEQGTIIPLYEKIEGYDETFEDYLIGYTNIRQYLNEEYCKIMGDRMYSSSEERKKFDDWFDLIFNQVKLYHDKDKENYHDKVFKLYKDSLEKLSESTSKEKIYHNNDVDERFGLIHFNTTKALDEFSNFGINDGDDCISIHFTDLIEQKNKDHTVSNIFSGESLSKLAVEIIEKYPETKAVIAQSWLVDSPIGKRVGFTSAKKINDVVQDTRFWGQFIDEEGKIKKDKIQKFLNTGIPEFYITDGFIKTEDFLKKYLPKEYKGKTIKLKEISDESKKFNKDLESLSKELNDKWDSGSYDEIVTIINKNEIVSEYLNTLEGQDYLKIIKKLKEQNLDNKAIDKIDFKNKDEIMKKFDDFIKDNRSKYIEKDIIIE